MDKDKVKKIGYTATGAVIGGTVGQAVGGLILGPIGARLGRLAGAVAGGAYGYGLAKKDPAPPEETSAEAAEPETPDDEPAVDAEFAET